jgi:hypothetical protein
MVRSKRGTEICCCTLFSLKPALCFIISLNFIESVFFSIMTIASNFEFLKIGSGLLCKDPSTVSRYLILVADMFCSFYVCQISF